MSDLELRRRLRTFINQAEAAWFKVYDSSLGRKVIVVRGDEYIQLPLQFSIRPKIIAFFRKYWSPAFSQVQFCNLKSILFRGRRYVILADPGPVPNHVVSLRIICQTSTRIRVRAVLSGGSSGNVVIFYTIARSSSNGLTIISRTGLKNDYRFIPCK
ncbi:hypothetical protein ACFPYJ_02865 [Paenibacillus solisilvae]|uniref:Uncharacterized protein n=1 Tax=Paenibacillus solisilvae TaxID=2486751 RepID=A0ABW0VTF0_9BACL